MRAAIFPPCSPLAGHDDGLSGYLQAHHAVVSGDSGRPTLEAALRLRGATIIPAATVNHFASLPPLLTARNDLIATVPVSIAAGWAATWPLVLRALRGEPGEFSAIGAPHPAG